MSVLDSARLVAEVVNEVTGLRRELKMEFVPFADIFGQYKDIMRRLPDLSKARSLLGYQPKYRTRDAIKETITIHYQELKASGIL
jgi:nucleoside-diphosphate-sugar epimerase